jgi:hypothetical protein
MYLSPGNRSMAHPPRSGSNIGSLFSSREVRPLNLG